MLDLTDHVIQILKLVFVHFDNTKSSVIVFIGDRLDAGTLTGTRIAKQQTVIGLPAGDKSVGIVRQFLFGDVIAHQLV